MIKANFFLVLIVCSGAISVYIWKQKILHCFICDKLENIWAVIRGVAILLLFVISLTFLAKFCSGSSSQPFEYIKSGYLLIIVESCEHPRGKPLWGSWGIQPPENFEILKLSNAISSVLGGQFLSKMFTKLIVI